MFKGAKELREPVKYVDSFIGAVLVITAPIRKVLIDTIIFKCVLSKRTPRKVFLIIPHNIYEKSHLF